MRIAAHSIRISERSNPRAFRIDERLELAIIMQSMSVDLSELVLGHLELPERPRDLVGTSAALRTWLENANTEIFARAGWDRAYRGAGALVAAAVSVGRSLVIANVGTCTVFRLRGSDVDELTRDDSLAAAIRRGEVSLGNDPDTEAHGPFEALTFRALGLSDHVDVFTGVVACAVGDVFVLCEKRSSATIDSLTRAAPLCGTPDEIARSLCARFIEDDECRNTVCAVMFV